MKKATFTAAAAAIGVVLAASNVSAVELWDPHLRGVDDGLAAGALPPQGVYFVNDSYFVSYRSSTSNSPSSLHVDAYIDVPIVLWNPGIKVLGADFAVAIAQPFDYNNAYNGTAGSSSGELGGHIGTFNTVLVPAILSWALPYDLHVKPSFSIFLDDASSTPAFGNTPKTGLGAGMAATVFEPGVGLSWLHDGWNVSGQFGYDTSTEDSHNATYGVKYQSGDQFWADYTVTKTLGKWTVGLGADQINQLSRDQIGGRDRAGTVVLDVSAGPIIGYQFGGIGIQAHFDHGLVVHNDVGGDHLNVRVVVPLY